MKIKNFNIKVHKSKKIENKNIFLINKRQLKKENNQYMLHHNKIAIKIKVKMKLLSRIILNLVQVNGNLIVQLNHCKH